VYFNNKTKTSNGILQIDDNFATLVNVTTSSPHPRAQFSENELQFEFSYKLSQLKAIEQNSFSVAITLRTRMPPRPVIVTSRKLGDIDTDKLLDNILGHKAKMNNIRQNERSVILAYKESDITAKINNQILPLLKNKFPLEGVGLQKNKIIVTKIEEKDSEETQVSGIIKRNVGHAATSGTGLNINSDSLIDSREAIIDLIQKKSLPPSVVTVTSDRSLSTHNHLNGLIRKNTYPEYVGNPLTKLVNSYIFQGQGTRQVSEYVTSVGQTFDDTITIKTRVSIKNDIVKTIRNQFSSLVNVKFELLQTSNESGTRQVFPIEVIEKELNIEEHLRNYFTPSLPPTAVASRSGSNVTLQIKQNDDRSNGLRIYKKAFSISDRNVMTSYNLIDTASLSKENGLMSFTYTNLNEENVIYRVIPYNKFSPDFLPPVFSDVLINNKHTTSTNKKLVIIPQHTNKGIVVTAYGGYFNIAAARLLIRNITKRQTKYTKINDVFYFQNPDSESSLLLDSNLIPYHLYELTTMIIEKNGVETMSSYSTFFEYVPYIGNPFSVNISNSINSGNDMQFSVTAELIQDQIGVFKALLNQVDATYDERQLTSRKANYDKFISFSIVRYNISTGEVEDLGIIPNGATFVDSNRSALYSAKHLAYNNQYTYMIYPLVRDPETVISQKKELRDSETRKKYNVNPRKHLHPLTLNRGSVVSKRVIEQESDPKNDNLYGFIGTSYQTNLSLTAQKPSISNFNASMLNDDNAYLTWSIRGDQNLIDHLVILTEIDGVRRIIGKCHALSREQATFSYKVSKHDVGYTRFILIPIFSDFSSGQASVSNPLLITQVEG